MPAEIPGAFDCKATAAVLKSGSTVALAGHAAAIMSVLVIVSPIWKGGFGIWMEGCSIMVWCAVVYLAVRVKIDAGFFKLLADESADDLDTWLDAAGLRKKAAAKALQERRRGALKLWRALGGAVALEIGLMLLGLLRLLS
jgi:hypothetical protein